MSPYDDLDDSQRKLVDNIVHYDIVAENCAAYLCQYDMALISRLWAEQEAIFMGDPVTYPSRTVSSRDPEGRNRFRQKCEALCFPPGSNRPLQDHIMMYFAAAAGMQLAHAEADEDCQRSDLCRIANDQMVQRHPTDEVEYTDDDKPSQDPLELIDQNIRCHDRSGKVIEYVVVDYLNSIIGGDYFMLEDQQGRRYNITPEELDEIRID